MRYLFLSLLFVLTLLISCDNQKNSSQKIIITGSSTIAPVLSEIAKQFEKDNPGIRIDVQTGGSSRGIADTRKGIAHIGMVSRSPKQEEKDLQWFPFASDGICMIAHQSNPLENLNAKSIRALYTKKIENWKKIGGEDSPITIVHKAEGRSTLEVFLKFFQLKNTEIKADLIIGDNQQGIKLVSNSPNAIGYVSIGAAEFEAKKGTKIKLLRFKDVVPSVANIKNKAFPIARTLHLITKKPPEGIQKKFLDYCLSEEVHQLIQEQYFVPLQK